MAVGGHIGFWYFDAPGSVTDKHLDDLSCIRTNSLTSSEKSCQPNFANGTSDLVLHYFAIVDDLNFEFKESVAPDWFV
ncbi:hypothetical protein DPMN_059485 [Dreissena polymorpha]|uniref:Uncharacterized protein n=1 Tax=Dreissena polymorpha TaxID=45954 RepID=A0A9D4C3K2_DREPO|nr:hypothetical protein DPMN_059485 [Dreissena polymorpha]